MIKDLNYILEKNKNTYEVNKPFPHIRLENLFPDKLLDDVVDNIFNIKDEYKWWKLCTEGNDFSEFGESAVELTNYLISDHWVSFLSELTGVENLRSDKYWHSAGINFEPRGSHLEPHADFNKSSNGWRRVNVLLFLSKDWRDEWGGHNELGQFEWAQGAPNKEYKKIKSYKPEFNTMVIFNTSPISFHGFDIVRCPEDSARIVIGCYYYSDDRGPHANPKSTTNYIGWDKERKQNKEYRGRGGTGWRKLK